MTTIIALASKHAVVMGADSLATLSKRMIDPSRLVGYFDPGDNFSLKVGTDGVPLLPNFLQLVSEAEHVPFNQSLHVNKLFKIGNLPIGAMFTGLSSVGDRPVRSIVAEFVDTDIAAIEAQIERGCEESYTVRGLAEKLLALLSKYYQEAYGNGFSKPELELLIAGYNAGETFPTVVRVGVASNEVVKAYDPGEFGVVFGGQMDWIQRIVFGADDQNKRTLAQRSRDLMERYRQLLVDHVRPHGITDLPPPPSELSFFADWNLEELQADWANFSEQNAINCVDFFLRIMIGSQDVSPRLPTVGGNVHIAVIRKKEGFHPVSREVWRHGDHEVPIPEVGR